MNENREYWLKRLSEDALRSEQATIESKTTPELLCGMEGAFKKASNFALAWHELYYNLNVEQAKQRFYKSGLLACWLANHCKIDALSTGVATIAVLLSDSPGLLSKYADSTAQTYEYMVTRSIAVFDKLVQLHLKEDTNGIGHYMKVAQDKILPKYKYSLLMLEFFKALERKDVPAMESQIQQMLLPKNRKYFDRDDRYVDLFSFPAIKCAKLAWIKGFQVQVDSPLIPADILPVIPLDIYEGYSFPFSIE